MPTLRFRALGALLPALLLLSACADDLDERPRIANVDIDFDAWALTGSPPSFPTALVVPQFATIPADANGEFDIAFDIDANGDLQVYPVSMVVSALTGSRAIGLLLGVGEYDAVVEAPRVGWAFDEMLTVSEGQTFLVKVQTTFCQFDIRQDLHAKIQVVSIFPAERRAVLQARINPNCGSRSFATGIPEF